MKLCLKLLFVASVLGISVASAQVATGTPPFGSFGGGPFDVINLGNLNAHFSIPVLHKAGRGMPFAYDLTYDNSIWTPVTSSGTTTWQPDSNWGWKDLSEAAVGYVYQTATQTLCKYFINGRWQSYYYTVWNTLGYSDRFGVLHPTYIYTDDDQQQYCGIDQLTGSAGATDGSGYSISVSGGFAATVTSSDGRQFNVPITRKSGSGSITDMNGNQITQNTSGQFFDTLSTSAALTVIAPAPPATTQFQYAGPNGTATVKMNYTKYTVKTNFGVSNTSGLIHEYGPTTNSLVSSITLPDNSTYSFIYEQTPGTCQPNPGDYTYCVTGRLLNIVLPTGGTIAYGYTGGPNNTGINLDGSASGLTRQLWPFGQQSGPQWTYSRSQVGTDHHWETTVTTPPDPQNQPSVGNDTVIDFQTYAAPHQAAPNFYETQRVIYQGASTANNVLLTLLTCYNVHFSNCTTTALAGSISQKDVFQEVPQGSTTKNSLSEIKYSGGLVTEDKEYDYGVALGVAPSATYLLTDTVINYSLLRSIANRPSQITVKDGQGNTKSQTTYSYDQNALQTTTSTPQHVSAPTIRGNPTTITALTSGTATLTKTFTYYDTGNVYKATDANSGVTTFQYAACGNSFLTETDLPLSLVTKLTWDCNGAVITSSTGANTNQTSNSYDTTNNIWRLAGTTYPDGGSASVTYNTGTNHPWSVVDSMAKDIANNVTSEVIVDDFGRTAETDLTSDPVATDRVVNTYDALGRLASVSNPYRTTSDQTYGITQFSYDALYRTRAVIHPDSSQVSYNYTGAATQVQDEGYNSGGASHITHIYQADGLGRTTSACEVSSTTLQGSAGTPASCGLDYAGTGFLTTYQYDPLGNITQVQQPGVSARTYSYDGLSRLTQEVNAESGTITYTYDAAGQQGDLATRTRPKQNQTGSSTTITTFTFDVLHRMTGKSYNDGSTPSVTFSYDQTSVGSYSPGNPKGQLTNAVVAGNVAGTIFGYDTMGRIAQEWQCTPLNCGSSTFSLAYQYDFLGDVTQFVNSSEHTSGVTYAYSYDAAARLNKLTSTWSDSYHPATLLTINQLDYNPLGKPTKATLGNGIVRTINYDTWGRPTSLTDGSIYSFSLGYAKDSNILTGSDSVNGNWTYTYDEMARLSTASKTGNALNWKYDPAGNRWQQNATQGSGQQPQYSFTGSNNRIDTYSYDAAGNLLNDTFHAYTYDAEGRVTAVDAQNQTHPIYTYDAFGKRVRTAGTGQTSDFIFDPAGRALDQMSGTTWQRGEIFAGGHMATYNNLVSPATTYFEHTDWVGTVRARSSAAGASVETCTSLPFGDNQICTGTDGSPVHFAMLNWDSESNLQHAWFRQYSTTEGRWSIPDPSGLGAVDPSTPQTWNRYAYVLNNPINLFDPLGLIDDCGGPCTPFWLDLGNGCSQLVTYYQSGGYDIPSFGPVSCTGGQGGGAAGGSGRNGGGGGHGFWQSMKQGFCSGLPSGRVTSVGGSIGAIGGETGSVSQVVNYNTGQVSFFASGGLQAGWNGGASASASMGFVWNMASNTDFSGPFNNVSGGSSEGPGGTLSWASNGVKVAAVSMSASLIPSPTGGYSYTVTSQPLNTGNIATNAPGNPLFPLDAMYFGLNQMCKQ
jgi:RHS repeat-associated protein